MSNDISPLQAILDTARDPDTGEPMEVKLTDMPAPPVIELSASEKLALNKLVAQGRLTTLKLGELALQEASINALLKELVDGRAAIIKENGEVRAELQKRAEEILVSRGIDDLKAWNFDVDTFEFKKLR